MRVKCLRLQHNGKILKSGSDGWLTVGKEYLVIGLHCGQAREPSYWVLTDEPNSPIFKGISFFEVVDGTIPGTWIARSFVAGGFEIIPKEFSDHFSLEDLVNKTPDAIACFNAIVAKLENK